MRAMSSQNMFGMSLILLAIWNLDGADRFTNFKAITKIKFQRSAIYVCSFKLYVHIIYIRICLGYF